MLTASAGFNQTAPIIGDAYNSLLAKQQYTLSVEVPIIQWGAHKAAVEAAIGVIQKTFFQEVSSRIFYSLEELNLVFREPPELPSFRRWLDALAHERRASPPGATTWPG